MLRLGLFGLLFGVAACLVAPAASADEPRIFGPPFAMQPDVTLGPVTGPQYDVAIAAGDGQFLAAWADNRRIQYNYILGWFTVGATAFYGRFSADGTALDPVGVPLSGARTDDWPAIAWNGSNYLVVWNSAPSTNLGDIYACRVSPEGVMLDGFGGFLVASNSDEDWGASVACDGTDWFVVWQLGYLDAPETKILGTKITALGQVVTPGGARICQTESWQCEPTVAWTGGAYMVAFHGYPNDPNAADVYATRVLADGTVLDPNGILVCSAIGYQGKTSVARLGPGVGLIAWEDSRSPIGRDIYAARVSETGLVADPNGFAVCTAPGDQRFPCASSATAGCVLAWQDYRLSPYAAYAARVAPDGTVLEPGGIRVSTTGTYQARPQVATDSDTCVFAWAEAPAGDEGASDVMAKRFVFGGVPGGSDPFRITRAAPYQRSLAVCRTTTGFMTAFEENDTGPYNPDLFIAPLDADGNITPAGEILVKGDSEWDVLPAVAFDGTDCLVVWVNTRSDMGDIYGVRVTPQGLILDPAPIPICVAEEPQIPVTVGYGGGVYLVVWEDGRGEKMHIYGARVTPDGTVLDLNGFMICACPTGNGAADPALVWNGSRFLVTWTELFGDAPGDAGSKIMARFLDPSNPPGGSLPIQMEYAEYPKWAARPAPDWSGTNHLVCWEDWPGEGYLPQVRGKRITPDGTILDATPITIRTTDDNHRPLTAWNTDHRVVAWSSWTADADKIFYLARVSEDGTVIDPEGMPVRDQPGDCLDHALCPRGDGKVLLFGETFTPQSPYGIDRIFECWFTPPQIVPGIAAARLTPSDSLITVLAKPVTAGTNELAGVFYIEEPDRSAGMRVLWNKSAVPRGLYAAVSGLVKTVGGERVIEAQAVCTGETIPEPVGPLGLVNRSLGGSSPDPLVPQIDDSCGAYNVGLLVKTWGEVTAVGGDWFYVDDGSSLDDGSGSDGLKVALAGLSMPPPPGTMPDVGDYVAVTGLSSCESQAVGGSVVRLLRPRNAADILDLSQD